MDWSTASESGACSDAAPMTAQRAVSAEGDDDDVLVRAARRDPRAFVALYDRYFSKVLGYARLQLRDPEAAADAVSLVFEKALRNLPDFRGSGSFAGWLFRIAHNVIRDLQRRRDPETISAEDCDAAPDPHPGPEERMLHAERRAQLRDLVRRLRPEQRHLLALRYGAGLSFREIAAITGYSSGALRVRIHRILETLRGGFADAP